MVPLFISLEDAITDDGKGYGVPFFKSDRSYHSTRPRFSLIRSGVSTLQYSEGVMMTEML